MGNMINRSPATPASLAIGRPLGLWATVLLGLSGLYVAINVWLGIHPYLQNRTIGISSLSDGRILLRNGWIGSSPDYAVSYFPGCADNVMNQQVCERDYPFNEQFMRGWPFVWKIESYEYGELRALVGYNYLVIGSWTLMVGWIATTIWWISRLKTAGVSLADGLRDVFLTIR
jgi:hypothetical protein